MYSFGNPGLLEAEETSVLDRKVHNLIIWNDDVNTFDWVIDSLIEVCDHSPEQAEQCALLIHLKGKYAVKTGDYGTLKDMCLQLLDRSIQATIDS